MKNLLLAALATFSLATPSFALTPNAQDTATINGCIVENASEFFLDEYIGAEFNLNNKDLGLIEAFDTFDFQVEINFENQFPAGIENCIDMEASTVFMDYRIEITGDGPFSDTPVFDLQLPMQSFFNETGVVLLFSMTADNFSGTAIRTFSQDSTLYFNIYGTDTIPIEGASGIVDLSN